MSELKEKRKYYPDRSLKSVYFVDEQGRKQGKLMVYVQNTGILEYTADYVDDILRKRERPKSAENPWGMVEEFDEKGVCRKKQYKATDGNYQVTKEYDENGLISHDFHNAEVYNKFCCRLVYINKVDLYYKDGQPWEGDIFEVHTEGDKYAKYFNYGYDDGYIVNEQHYKEGKLNGTYVDTYSDGASSLLLRKTRGEKANFKEGILDGEYKARCSNMRRPDFKFIKFSEYGIKPKSINYSGYYRINGNFIQGVFSGSIECGYEPNNLYVIENGKLKRSVEYLGKNHWIEKNYEDGKLVRASEKIAERMVVFERGTYGHEGISSLNEVEYKEGKLHGTSKKFNKDSLWIESEIQYKNGKKHGLAKKYNEKGWLESETQYKDGLKHGFETKYNSDGTIASQKYYENGVNCTMVHKALKKAWNKVASKRIDKEKAIEAKTGVKTRLPKMSKGAKIAAMVKESIGLSK